MASTAYLGLFLRSVTQPGLLHSFLRFLMCEQYDGERVIDKMVQRLGTKSRVSIQKDTRQLIIFKVFYNLLISLPGLDVFFFFSYAWPLATLLTVSQ